jgi:hypothetical protein
MSRKSAKVFQGGLTEKATKENSGPAPAMKPPERFIPSMSGLQRRESSRMSRLPSRLEEDNPQAEMDRYMEKCGQIVKELMDIDVQKIFCAPVDPIALGIPQYPDIIKEPMDLGTIKTKLDNNEIDTPEEFKRLVNLTFMNAITFNNMPDNPVHLMARDFMTRFNNKFGSIDKAYNAAKKNKKLTKAERQDLRKKEKEAAKEAKRKVKEEKERKRKAEVEAANESKRMKLENVVASNKSTMAAIAQAAPSDPDANMTRTEYNLLINAIKQVQEQIVGLHKLIKKTKSTSSSGSANKKTTSDAPSAFGAASSFAYAETAETHSSSKPKKKKAKKEEEEYQPKFESPPSSPSPKTYPKRAPVEEEDLQPLTFEEQEALSESINLLPERLLPGAMQIIRESEFVNDDDDEIDLDIDQLDTKTQRKLQKFVMENVKQKKKKKGPKKGKSAAAPVPAPSTPPPPEPEEEEKPASSGKRLPGGKSFFALGDDDDDSDDDKDDEDDEDLQTDFASAFAKPSQDDADEEKKESAAGGDDAGSDNDDDEENDLWDAARKEAEVSKAQAEDRAKREEKLKRQAELDAQKRMAEAQELGEQAKIKREEEERKRQAELEEEERKAEEEREKARQAAFDEVNNVQNTVDLDETRNLMEQYEREFNDNYSAGASPSSDFGF